MTAIKETKQGAVRGALPGRVWNVKIKRNGETFRIKECLDRACSSVRYFAAFTVDRIAERKQSPWYLMTRDELDDWFSKLEIVSGPEAP
jgi:hypothetical protein